MTKSEFTERWRDELAGMLLDAATSGRAGADLALWVRNAMKKIDEKLGQMHATAQAEWTIDEEAEALLKRWGTVGPDAQKKIVDRMRAAFTPKVETNGSKK